MILRLRDQAWLAGLCVSFMLFLFGCAPRTPIRHVALAPVVAKPPPPKPAPKKKALLPICPQEDESGGTAYNPARVKLTIVNPDPDACDVELKVLEVPRQPCRKVTRKSGTELAAPVFDLFRKLNAQAFLKMTVTNAADFLKARTALEIPTEFEAKVNERWKFTGLTNQTEIAIAKRSLSALHEREKRGVSIKEPTGMVCIDLSLLKTPEDQQPLSGKFRFGKSELIKMKLRQTGVKPRSAAVSLERANGLASTLARFNFTSPLRVVRNIEAFGKIIQNQSTSDCVWTLSALNPNDGSRQQNFSLPVPRDGGLLASRFLRVRVAKEGQGILGKPVLLKTGGTMKDFPPATSAPLRKENSTSNNNETLF